MGLIIEEVKVSTVNGKADTTVDSALDVAGIETVGNPADELTALLVAIVLHKALRTFCVLRVVNKGQLQERSVFLSKKASEGICCRKNWMLVETPKNKRPSEQEVQAEQCNAKHSIGLVLTSI